MYSDSLRYVKSCHLCQRTKTSTRSRKAPLKPLEVFSPFDRIHVDHIGPLPLANNGYRYLLVIVDSCSGWPEVYPTVTTSTEEVAEILYKEIVTRYGVFSSIISDQVRSYKNRINRIVFGLSIRPCVRPSMCLETLRMHTTLGFNGHFSR